MTNENDKQYKLRPFGNPPFQTAVLSSGSSAPERQQLINQIIQGPEWPEAGDTAIEQAQTIKPSFTAQAALVKANKAAEFQAEQKKEFLNLVQDLESFDWKNIKPYIMAQILAKIPRKGKKDEPDYYLTLDQAFTFACEAYRMGLSPLSNQCFFVRETWKVNATLEGKKKMSRDVGMNFGPPKFERLTKPFNKGKVIAGFTEDIGCKCSMEVKGFSDRAEYTAWLSEWYVSTSPVWREKPEHMLQTRAQEKCISSASGVGASEMPHENDIEPPITGQISAGKEIELIPSFTGEQK